MAGLWTVTAVLLAFFSSFLLFSVQPIIGRIFLPFLGGSPAVWNTCMMFFQSLLLVGYIYSHLLSQKVAQKYQPGWHLVLGAITMLVLPIGLPVSMINVDLITERPIYWLLFSLLVTVGPVFFFLSCMSPLIQSWYHRIRPGKNPYALFAASNSGSLLALILYPLYFESAFSVSKQAQLWSAGYLINGGFLLIMAVFVFLSRRGNAEAGVVLESAVAWDGNEEIEGELQDFDLEQWGRINQFNWDLLWKRSWWFLLAFIPSSLLMGVTSFLTTDVAAIPMLWVLPLAVYLLTYIIAFGPYGKKSDRFFTFILPIAVALLLFLIFAEYRQNLWLCMSAHLTLFFIIGLAVHGRLALTRPDPKRLTEFYVIVAAGGMAGGILNALIAPQVFNILAEYPLVAAMSLVLLFSQEHFQWKKTPILLAAAAASGVALLYGSDLLYDTGWLSDLIPADKWELEQSVIRITLLFGLPLLLIPLVYANGKFAAAALIGFALVATGFEPDANVILQKRSLYGTVTVKQYADPKVHTLVHGGILHGEQRVDSVEAKLEPRSYYHREGALGQLMDILTRHRTYPRIAALGMGTGSIAAYGTRNNEITFYELDPNIIKIAQDPRLFTYVDDCRRRWCNLKIVTGDARLKIIGSEDQYDAVIVDAFSSDAIPVHLITREAVVNYLEKMDQEGLLIFHISNRYVNLEPVLLGIATELGLGFALRSDEADDAIGKGAATWVVLTREMGLFDELISDNRWSGLNELSGVGVWTDDHAALLKVFTWF